LAFVRRDPHNVITIATNNPSMHASERSFCVQGDGISSPSISLAITGSIGPTTTTLSNETATLLVSRLEVRAIPINPRYCDRGGTDAGAIRTRKVASYDILKKSFHGKFDTILLRRRVN